MNAEQNPIISDIADYKGLDQSFQDTVNHLVLVKHHMWDASIRLHEILMLSNIQ